MKKLNNTEAELKKALLIKIKREYRREYRKYRNFLRISEIS